MSPFLTAQEVDRIVHEVGESVELYAGGNDNGRLLPAKVYI